MVTELPIADFRLPITRALLRTLDWAPLVSYQNIDSLQQKTEVK